MSGTPKETNEFLSTLNKSMSGTTEIASQLIQTLSSLQAAFDKLYQSDRPIRNIQSSIQQNIPYGVQQTAVSSEQFLSYKKTKAAAEASFGTVPAIGAAGDFSDAVNQHAEKLQAIGVSPKEAYGTIQAIRSVETMKGKNIQDILSAVPAEEFQNVSKILDVIPGALSGYESESIAKMSRDPENLKKIHQIQSLDSEKRPESLMRGYSLIQTQEARSEAARDVILGRATTAETMDIFGRNSLLKQVQSTDLASLQSTLQNAAKGESGQSSQQIYVAKEYASKIDALIQATKNHENTLNTLAQKEMQLSELSNTKTDEDIKKKDDLRREVENLRGEVSNQTKALQELEDVKKAAKFTGGGGDGPEDPNSLTLRQNIEKWSSIITKGIAVVSGVVSTGYSAAATARQEVVGKERGLWESEFATQSILANRAISSMDMTRPENLLKFRGDMALPGLFKFQGQEGFERSQLLAMREVADRLKLSETLMNRAGWQAAFGVASGVGAAASGLATGGPMGYAAAAWGGKQAMDAVKDYYQEVSVNEAKQLEGGIAGTWMGKAFHGSDAERRAKINAERQFNLFKQDVVRIQEEIQQRELEANPMASIFAQQTQKMIEAQAQGVSMVGLAGKTRKGIMRELFGEPSNEERQMRQLRYGQVGFDFSPLHSAEEPTGRVERDATQPLLGFDTRRDIASYRDRGSYYKNRSSVETYATTSSLLQSRVDEKTGMGLADFIERDKEQARYDLRTQGKVRRSPASDVGMLIPEFMMHANMLSNVIGRETFFAPGLKKGEASAQMTKDFVELSRSGLGDFQQLTGNLAALNQISGGQNNIEQLKNILGAAVRAGFDGSRVAQAFTQTSMSLADSLRLSKVDVASAHLSDTMKWISTQGKGDERAMRLAAEGIKSFESFSSQQSGFIGANRLYSMLTAGATVGQTSLMKDLGPAAIEDIKSDIEAAEKTKGGFSVRDPRRWAKNITTWQLFQSEKASRREQYIKSATENNQITKETAWLEYESKAAKPEEAKEILKSVREKIESSQDAVTRYAPNLFRFATGMDLDEKVNIIKGLSGRGIPGKKEKARDVATAELATGLTQAFMSTDMTREAAYEAAALTMRQKDIDQTTITKTLSRQRIQEANRQFLDPAKEALAMSINEITARGTGVEKMEKSEYLKMVSEEKIAARTVRMGDGTSVKITPAMAEQLRRGEDIKGYDTAKLQEAITTDLENVDRYEIARTAIQAISGEQVQKVWIQNAFEIGRNVSEYIKASGLTIEFDRNKIKGS